MQKIYVYIENPRIYGIYKKGINLLIISTNPESEKGAIYITE